MKAVYKRIAKLVDKVFPHAGAVEHLLKLKEETEEAIAEPDDVSEYADCFIALVGAAHKAGISFELFTLAIERKMEINESREWEEQADGTYKHKE